MAGRRRSPAADPHRCRQCPLCGDLPQAHIHFDAGWWETLKLAAETRMAEAQAEADEAARHLRMLAKETCAPATSGGRSG